MILFGKFAKSDRRDEIWSPIPPVINPCIASTLTVDLPKSFRNYLPLAKAGRLESDYTRDASRLGASVRGGRARAVWAGWLTDSAVSRTALRVLLPLPAFPDSHS